MLKKAKRACAFFLPVAIAAILLGYPARGLLTRLPYLQEMTSHSVLIAWRTRTPDAGLVEYKAHTGRTLEKIERLQEKAPTRDHAIRIVGLKGNVTYWYRVEEANPETPLTGWLWFKTFPDSTNASFSFAVFGDSGNGSSYQKAVARQLFLHHPDLVIHTGDVIYGGETPHDFDARFFSIYGKLAETTPFFPSLGNHDEAWNGGKPYLENFYLPQDSPGKGRYYSFNCGQVHFVALDSNEPARKGDPQYEWFVKDMKANRLPLRVVYFHHPVYSSGYHGSTGWIRKNLEPLFDRFHVTVVFNGHDHDYERTVPIHGVTYVVTGGGGGILYPVSFSSWTAYSATVHHFVLCQVQGKTIRLEAVDDTGKGFDHDTLRAW